MEIEEIFA